MSQTLAELIRAAVRQLEQAGIEDPQREARLLAARVTGVAPARLPLVLDTPLSSQNVDHFDRLVAQRVTRMPLSHILGRRAFYNNEFLVTPFVLDPRPDTETMVAEALKAPFAHVLDLGTGSGCILLSLLAERPDASGLGTDLSPDALDVARRNADRLYLTDRCLFLCGNWYEGVEGRFDLIVSNPPYIAADEMPDLSAEIRHEPRMALTDEADGLSAYRVIVPGAGAHMTPGGRLLVEIGWTQADAVSALFAQAGFQQITVIKDIDHRDRVICGVWPT